MFQNDSNMRENQHMSRHDIGAFMWILAVYTFYGKDSLNQWIKTPNGITRFIDFNPKTRIVTVEKHDSEKKTYEIDEVKYEDCSQVWTRID